MTKKMNHFLRNLVLRERMFPRFNIDPIPSFHGNDSSWSATKFSSLWLCFCLTSACKKFCSSLPNRDNLRRRASRFFVVLLLPLIGLKKLSHPVVTLVLRADRQELFLCRCSNPSQTYLIHEKFWPKSEYCLYSRNNSDLTSMFTVKVTGCNFQHGSHPFGCDVESSLSEECIHDKPLYWIV